MITGPFKKLFSFGSGIGIEIAGSHGSESLRIAAVRVRPNGARVLSRLEIENFTAQPASLWGTEFASFARKLGMRQVAACVILPRQDVIVRQLALPGVSDKDLDAAVGFQLDGLHPYPEEDVVASWTRLGSTPAVLVAIARRAAIDRYATLFAEAGIKIAGFTCSAAAIYSGLRFFHDAPREILASEPNGGSVEIYGESPTRPLFSASFDGDAARAASLACSELRIDSTTAPKPLEEILHGSPALPYAAALASACPRLSLSLNLLPSEQRDASSRVAWTPSAVLGAIVLLLAGALYAFPSYENRKYLKSLDAEIAKIQPVASRAAALDKQTEVLRRRVSQLDDFRRHAKADMDVLREMTNILPPPTWLNLLDLNRAQVILAGETPQSEPLLKTIDASPLFESSEFLAPPVRVQSPDRSQTNEVFRIRTHREAGK